MKKKIVILALAFVLVFALGIGGTLAWLTDKTNEVKNTFTVGDVNIELKETKTPDGTEVAAGVTDWSAQMIPGYTYSKNPKVTVKANSVDCYLFVKFVEPTANSALEYTSNLTSESWTQGTGEEEGKNGVPTSVWYREVTSSTSDQSWELIANNRVKIKEDLTKTTMPTSSLTMTYTAYACQLNKDDNAKFSPAEAWEKVKDLASSDSSPTVTE